MSRFDVQLITSELKGGYVMESIATRTVCAIIFGLLLTAPATLSAQKNIDASMLHSPQVEAPEVLTLAAVTNTVGDYSAFLTALRHRESGGNYQVINTLNFVGAYQFGEAALIDLGYVRRDSDVYNNDFSGGFTGKHGIRSLQQFINSPDVQDRAVQDWMGLMWHYIRSDGLDQYAWREVGGVTLSPSGMLAATHLLGAGGLREFVDSNGSADIRDPYGMPLRNYIIDLGGYDIPFGPSLPDFL
jgi:hypothetical protein